MNNGMHAEKQRGREGDWGGGGGGDREQGREKDGGRDGERAECGSEAGEERV